MNTFIELLVGTFSNKRQAQSHPTRYAHIWVNHRLIEKIVSTVSKRTII